MAYQTALAIAQVITDIHRKKYLLPSIQKEFVWLADHILPKIYFTNSTNHIYND